MTALAGTTGTPDTVYVIFAIIQGVTAIEYGLIAVAVAVLIVAVFYKDNGFIQQLKNKFGDLTNAINGANTKVTQ